ncbi:5-formyltetrahydrofolate cyclo-ligase [Arthrobacter sp. zg-Y820]|uniref:5-formyltetrahydrofolate cyclo-ligase n=1 Tax=unclassified Arthrobacter TaxID=235627 RepID=UPI001E4B0366|nr:MULTISPECIES: 5-formyltetrahydrofolate cyclo-ligase [unclassified Arthrobacter]MCC9195863.1 5-formyltetrahydrofolate cyclo-ligase [Arthrobacter sp. zg-Y820]MDK1278723.1 5-formyltetrahydrofolate cyclo-ligase [Arthrobacter sp. zg.Y820]WIB08852.1 5-formyltetrahydrofolate cyclo-ligase [Arthrobacter sp. zg-Y820]
MTNPAAPTSKELARQLYRRLRRELPPDAPLAAGRSLAGHAAAVLPDLVRPGSTVAGYLSTGREPGTAPLLENLLEMGYDVVVPVCEPDRRLSWCRWKPGTPLLPGLFPSVPEPAGPRLSPAELPDLNLLLVPALAVDRNGVRMGKGGGYYDRFLSELRSGGNPAPAVGIVYDHELAPAGHWTPDPFDEPMDAVLTPSGWTGLAQRPVYS